MLPSTLCAALARNRFRKWELTAFVQRFHLCVQHHVGGSEIVPNRGTGLFLAFVCVLFNAMIAGILQQIWQCCLGKGQGCGLLSVGIA